MAEKLRSIVCLHCGGEVIISEDGKTATCKYCRKSYKIGSSLSDGATIDFALATEYWKTFRFADAKRKFLDVTKENADFAEAYWGAFLSEYGIEWGENRFGESVPTCHRARTVSVYDDKNYNNAIKFGENNEYAQLADKIETVRKEIISKSESEADYDVFICFKATEINEPRRKTSDYFLGRELYHDLTEDGYKVFFSAITLGQIKEQEFEPYIFKALSTARVMLLLCSENEKIESAWVKNEWGRFLDMKNGSGLIPVCGNIDEKYSPYSLPDELRKFNAIEYDGKLFQKIKEKIETFFPDKVKEREEKERAKRETEFKKRLEEQAEKFNKEKAEREELFNKQKEELYARLKEELSSKATSGAETGYSVKTDENEKERVKAIVEKGEKFFKEKEYEKAEEVLKPLAESGNADAQYWFGRCRLDRNDYDRAFFWYKKSAEQGHATAQNTLGNFYETGKGTEKNCETALLWYKKSAENGNEIGKYNVAQCYFFGKGVKINHAEGIKWYKASAESGCNEAYRRLALCYSSGNGTEKNYETAVNYFKKYVENGGAVPQEIGDCYYNGGFGLSKNHKEALKWYTRFAERGAFYANLVGDRIKELEGETVEKGIKLYKNKEYEKAEGVFSSFAESGDADAQYWLGRCLRDRKDYDGAIVWYKKSAEQGHAEAQGSLGVCYEMGRGVEKNNEKAFEWYKKSADNGNEIAKYNVGQCYYFGRGVEKNIEEGVKWFEKSADCGYKDACLRIAQCYESGDGVEKNYEKAVTYYKKYAEKGGIVQREIGDCYYNGGYGLAKDRKEALKWYKICASKGPFYASLVEDKIKIIEQELQFSEKQQNHGGSSGKGGLFSRIFGKNK